MRSYSRLLIAIFLVFQALSSNAQYSKEARKWMEDATGYYQAGDFYSALPLYLKTAEMYPNDPGIAYSVALCYMNTYQGIKAIKYLEVAMKGGIDDPMLPYHYGVSLHANSRFDESITMLNRFKSQKGMEKYYLTQAEKTILWCNNAKNLISHPEKVKITNLGPVINSKYPDYNPVISADESEMLYTSRREGSTGGKIFPGDNFPYEDIYMSGRNNNGEWRNPSNSGPINTESHDACVGLSPDGQTLFLYKVEETQEFGDLYVSYLKGENWSSPVSIGKNVNSDMWEPCATISADGKILIFVSNRKGSLNGSTDIYLSKKQADGSFGAPITLSTKINTIYNEFSPFLHADGKTLYFSSEGHTSMGGFDIFSCTINTETGEVLSDPVNIGYPINTTDDEIFFVWSADGKRAYFSSAREGGYGEKDIYVLEREEIKQEIALVIMKGYVYDCGNQAPLEAHIEVVDNSGGDLLGEYRSNSSTGKYIVALPAGKNYGVSVNAEGYAFYSKNIDIPNLKHFEEVEDKVCLNSIKVGTKFVLNNIFFDVDKATLRPESEAELERVLTILKENPTIKVELSGHTDSDGEAEHNLKLSEQRAHSVRDYLIAKGIPAERLTYKGYGETTPVAPNDTPENKQLNRRTEMIVIE